MTSCSFNAALVEIRVRWKRKVAEVRKSLKQIIPGKEKKNYWQSQKILTTRYPLVLINLDYYELENNLSSLTEPHLNKCINSYDLSLTSATLTLFRIERNT